MAKSKLIKAKKEKEEKYVKWGWTWKNIIIFIKRILRR